MSTGTATDANKHKRFTLPARLALVAGIAALGIAASSFSLAQVLRRRAPATALSMAPYDARIMAIRAERLAVPGDGPARPGLAAAFARRALQRDPTSVSAAATLGLIAAMRGDANGARRLFAYSQDLSRRDYRTHLWAIEDAVSRGDIPAALHQYDLALRTSRTAPDLLFPVLAMAISEPRIRAETARTLQKRPAWGPTFVRQVASKGPDFTAVVDLFAPLQRSRYPFPEGADASLIAGLISQNAFDRAWGYYAGIRPGARRDASRDPAFGAALVVPSAFDWNPVQDDNISSAVQPGSGASVFTFSVSPGPGGLLLRQLQMLPPGRYRLGGRSLGQFAGDVPPYWTLVCLNGTELGRVSIAPGDASQPFAGSFTVPSTCPIQWLSLIARSSDAIEGQNGEITRVSLQPIAS